MANSSKEDGYDSHYVQAFKMYLELSEEHKAMHGFTDKVLPGEFARIGEGKASLNILGVGSGGGQMDVHMLSILQTKLSAMPISVDITEPSAELINQFKALVAKTDSLQKVPFTWHNLSCAEYEKQLKDSKRYDFIHMIQMLYYLADYEAAIKYFHSLLKENGRLLLIHEVAKGGWETLWKTYKKELCTTSVTDYISAGDIKVKLDALGLKYEEHLAPNTIDITDCFTEGSERGEMLLDFITDKEHFHSCFTPEIRAGILDLLRNKCSTVKDGRVLFDCSLSCILVHA